MGDAWETWSTDRGCDRPTESPHPHTFSSPHSSTTTSVARAVQHRAERARASFTWRRRGMTTEDFGRSRTKTNVVTFIRAFVIGTTCALAAMALRRAETRVNAALREASAGASATTRQVSLEANTRDEKRWRTRDIDDGRDDGDEGAEAEERAWGEMLREGRDRAGEGVERFVSSTRGD